MLKDPRNITTCMHLHLMAENIERMRDHVTSMAEQVIHFKTGEKPENQQFSLDKISFGQNFMKLEYWKWYVLQSSL